MIYHKLKIYRSLQLRHFLHFLGIFELIFDFSPAKYFPYSKTILSECFLPVRVDTKPDEEVYDDFQDMKYI